MNIIDDIISYLPIISFNSYKKEAYNIKNVFIDNMLYNDEFIEQGELRDNEICYEGAKKEILVNKYERDSKLRNACILKYGVKCYVCDMEFYNVYGDRGKNFIEIHHKIPLYKINENRETCVDDLIPICSNCHSIIHRYRDELSINDLRLIVQNNKTKTEA